MSAQLRLVQPAAFNEPREVFPTLAPSSILAPGRDRRWLLNPISKKDSTLNHEYRATTAGLTSGALAITFLEPIQKLLCENLPEETPESIKRKFLMPIMASESLDGDATMELIRQNGGDAGTQDSLPMSILLVAAEYAVQALQCSRRGDEALAKTFLCDTAYYVGAVTGMVREASLSVDPSEPKLTDAQCVDIAAKHRANVKIAALAKQFNVSRKTIDKALLRGGRWTPK